MKPIRRFRFFEAQDDRSLVDKINQWIDEEGARVVNYTVLTRDGKPKILLFYETDENN